MRCGMNVLIMGLLLSAVPWAEVLAAEWVIGNQEHPWEEWGGEMAHSLRQGGKEAPDPWVDWVGSGFHPAGETILARIDVATEPGWLQPIRVDSSINLSIGLAERSIRNDAISGMVGAFTTVDGDIESFFANRYGVEFKRHTMLYFDLRWPFPVNRIRFYTRPGYGLFQVPAYTLAVNDGDPAAYVPLEGDRTGYDNWGEGIREWTILSQVRINVEHDIDIRLPTRYVRYVALLDTLIDIGAKTLWEFAEMEIYGDGFVPEFTYTSAIIPFENAANWGRLRWHAEVDSGATVTLRTRSGQTPDPYRYFVWTGIGPTGQMEVTRAEYRATKNDHNRRNLAGPVVEDTDNWSFWSLPYATSGETIVSPAPARYFQFELSVASSRPEARARIDSVAFEFSSPPVAQQLIGELGYDAVQPGHWEDFRYAIQARFGAQDTGFNAIRIVTPDQVDPASIRDLAVDGTAVSPDSVQMAADGFTLFLPAHVGPTSAGDSALVEMAFSTRIYVHGTSLSGSVFDSKTPAALAQSILPGDATEELNTDNLQVEWELGGSLVGSIQVFPNPFTPNGDGINDQVQIDYGLFQVDRAVPVSFTVYDLSGKAVYRLTGSESSGPRTIRWGGTNDAGELVVPGLYVWQIKADTAAGEYVESGTVALAY